MSGRLKGLAQIANSFFLMERIFRVTVVTMKLTINGSVKIMTINTAISTLKIAIAEVEWNYPLDYAIAFETAIEALQEKLEREKGLKMEVQNV